jgi:hypothetical protein
MERAMSFYTWVCKLQVSLSVTSPMGLIFAGYRNSHVVFDGLEEIDCYAAFFPTIVRPLKFRETGEVILNLVGPDTGDRDPAHIIREGTRFVLLEAGS